jgi:hypothetical protein
MGLGSNAQLQKLEGELEHLPRTLCFGETRKVNWQSLISVGGAMYSVPHELVDQGEKMATSGGISWPPVGRT